MPWPRASAVIVTAAGKLFSCGSVVCCVIKLIFRLFHCHSQLLLACAITHHSYVQSIVLEPCSRLIVQNNEAIDPLRWSVDGAASTGDVVFPTKMIALPIVSLMQ